MWQEKGVVISWCRDVNQGRRIGAGGYFEIQSSLEVLYKVSYILILQVGEIILIILISIMSKENLLYREYLKEYVSIK